MSAWRIQINLVIAPPQIAILVNIGASRNESGWNIADIRIKPYLPSLRRIPASTIEPATGASTWAFGSHKCTKYIGIFTINARIDKIHHENEDEEILWIRYILVIWRAPCSK